MKWFVDRSRVLALREIKLCPATCTEIHSIIRRQRICNEITSGSDMRNLTLLSTFRAVNLNSKLRDERANQLWNREITIAIESIESFYRAINNNKKEKLLRKLNLLFLSVLLVLKKKFYRWISKLYIFSKMKTAGIERHMIKSSRDK